MSVTKQLNTFEKWKTDYAHRRRIAQVGVAKDAWEAGVQAERERCARIAETMPNVDGFPVAIAIRKGDA